MKIDSHRPWPIPILIRREAIPSALADDLLALVQSGKGASSTVGVINAKKSAFTLLVECEREKIPLAEYIVDCADYMNQLMVGDAATALVDGMIAEAWAVTYEESGTHRIHAHHDSAWSGVLYLRTDGMVEGTGLIEFVDPRPAFVSRQVNAEDNVKALQPEDRMLVMFPSWLSHWVTPVQTDSQRVCVAFNVGFQRE